MELKRKITASLIISGISIFFSVVALAVSLPPSKPLGLDYLGLIVGILALLTTALIGWQIFLLVDLKEFDKRFEDVKKEIELENHKTMMNLDYSAWTMCYNEVVKVYRLDMEYQLIKHGVGALFHASKINDIEKCNQFVMILLKSIQDAPEIKIKKEDMENIMILMSNVENKSGINRYLELNKKLLSITED